jgi:NitT/TauT family transport system ATP-binding protein
LQGELLRIWEATRKTIVFITHGIDEAVVLGQRVAVMTSRPGTIKEVIEVPFQARSSEEDLRSSPDFSRLRHQIWELLKDEVSRAQQLEQNKSAHAHRPEAGEERDAEKGVAAGG